MPVLYSRLLPILALVFSAGLAVAPVSAAETDPDGRLFEASADPLADVEQALTKAGDDVGAIVADGIDVICKALESLAEPSRYLGAAGIGKPGQLVEVRDRHDPGYG